MDQVARSLVILGLALAGIGVLLYLSPTIPLLGKLPGDIRIERPGFTLYIPFTSCLVVSALVSGGFWLASRLR